MTANINLASEPFRRDRPILIASAAIGALLLLTLILLISLALIDRRSLRESRATLAQLNRQLAAVQNEQKRVGAELRRPENSEVIERSVFLNTLLTRKGISWTKIFADLEKIVPSNVRVLAIRPQVDSRNQIYLDMTVGADAPQPVLGFLQKLETSDSFSTPSVSGVLPPSQTDPFYRYRLSVNYAQRL